MAPLLTLEHSLLSVANPFPEVRFSENLQCHIVYPSLYLTSGPGSATDSPPALMLNYCKFVPHSLSKRLA